MTDEKYYCYDCEKELEGFEKAFIDNFVDFDEDGIKITVCRDCKQERFNKAFF